MSKEVLTAVHEHVHLEALSLYADKTALATGEGLWYIVRQHSTCAPLGSSLFGFKFSEY